MPLALKITTMGEKQTTIMPARCIGFKIQATDFGSIWAPLWQELIGHAD